MFQKPNSYEIVFFWANLNEEHVIHELGTGSRGPIAAEGADITYISQSRLREPVSKAEHSKRRLTPASGIAGWVNAGMIQRAISTIETGTRPMARVFHEDGSVAEW